MAQHYVFNGDADGLCGLQQLRLEDARAREATLVTGVKRDVALLSRVRAAAGDECTVLDVSLDVNRTALVELLAAGVAVRYFDHHFAGEVPVAPGFEPHLDPGPSVCTSLLVDRSLGGRHRGWALVGAYGDNLASEAEALARSSGFDAEARATLQELGVCLNYNAYGESLADLHIPPAELAEQMLPYEDPLEFARSSESCRVLYAGYRDDMARARRLEPHRRRPGASLYLLPDQPWARRASGVLANELTTANAGTAIAIVSPKPSGGYLVSLRVPASSSVGAEEFCRRFPSGGGRRTAAGINHLPPAELEAFASSFERVYGAEM